MKRVLITGAGGFAGGHIAAYLHQQGYQVTGIMRKNKKVVLFPMIVQDLSEKIEISENFDVIVHAAGSLPYNQTDFREFKKNNIDSMNNIVEFAKDKHIKRVIYLSTIGVHGEFRDESINEESDIINPGYYGLTKYVAELALRSEKQIESISLRMPGIIGKGSKGIWLPNTVEKFRDNEDVKIYSPDFMTTNFVHVLDLCKFIKILIETENLEHSVVTLACSERTSIRTLVQQIKLLTKSHSKIIVDNSIRKPFYLDNKCAVMMGYDSMTPLEIVQQYCTEV